MKQTTIGFLWLVNGIGIWLSVANLFYRISEKTMEYIICCVIAFPVLLLILILYILLRRMWYNMYDTKISYETETKKGDNNEK